MLNFQCVHPPVAYGNTLCKHNGVCLFQICAIECLVSLGTSVLVLVVMPQFDVLTNLFISGGVCIVSAILQIVYRLQRETWKIIFPICSLILTVVGNSLYIYCLQHSLSVCLSLFYYQYYSKQVYIQKLDLHHQFSLHRLKMMLLSVSAFDKF